MYHSPKASEQIKMLCVTERLPGKNSAPLHRSLFCSTPSGNCKEEKKIASSVCRSPSCSFAATSQYFTAEVFFIVDLLTTRSACDFLPRVAVEIILSSPI